MFQDHNHQDHIASSVIVGQTNKAPKNSGVIAIHEEPQLIPATIGHGDLSTRRDHNSTYSYKPESQNHQMSEPIIDARKTGTPIISVGGLSGRTYVVMRWRERGDGVIEAVEKYDITDQLSRQQ